MKLLFKLLAIVFCVLFVVSAYLQHNDPDPYLWYAVYSVAAVISILFVYEKLPMWLTLLTAIVFLIGAIIDWPQQFQGVAIGNGDIKNIEEGRESLGLIIAALVMGIYAARIWYIRRKTA